MIGSSVWADFKIRIFIWLMTSSKVLSMILYWNRRSAWWLLDLQQSVFCSSAWSYWYRDIGSGWDIDMVLCSFYIHWFDVFGYSEDYRMGHSRDIHSCGKYICKCIWTWDEGRQTWEEVRWRQFDAVDHISPHNRSALFLGTSMHSRYQTKA